MPPLLALPWQAERRKKGRTGKVTCAAPLLNAKFLLFVRLVRFRPRFGFCFRLVRRGLF
jgi:hypothetical protein